MNYIKIPESPESISGSNVLVRLLDGLIFRYYWATEGLTVKELTFRPCESSMNMIDLLDHIHHLANVTYKVLYDLPVEKTPLLSSYETARNSTLELYQQSRDKLAQMSDEELASCKFKRANNPIDIPFWNLVNGPVADALTHVGQINSWRRIAGNPAPKTDVFLGLANIDAAY